ncbi:MAG: glycosyltransferase [Euryarchaeota archaeon]|nr:glycosyltransferase [Euryarchaeota archaeon]MBV1729553.1 glycosyltransferase [Methanobacterium sp.]MBV1754280.1 glycosyltransferase [Methanobacterium sp.]
MEVSVIIPMYNEEENVSPTISQIKAVLDDSYRDYEIIVVDDGSQDKTLDLAQKISENESKLKVLQHEINQGMGKALRTGFEKARGEVIVTIDADLSYEPQEIPRLVSNINEAVGIVIGSQYMKGGKTQDIPFLRLFISKMANKIVGYSMGDNINTVTGVFRAYKKDVLDSIELESNGTEINPEILSKASAIGYKIVEVPVTLKARELGESKVRFRATTISHLLFTFYEKPMVLFGLIGLIILLIGIISGVYLFYQYLAGSLDPNRPLMLFMAIMVLSGIQILIFGFVATQISLLRREIYLVQKENKLVRKKLDKY